MLSSDVVNECDNQQCGDGGHVDGKRKSEREAEGGKDRGRGGRRERWEVGGKRGRRRERQGKEGKEGFSLGVSASTLNPSFKRQTRQWLLDTADLFH